LYFLTDLKQDIVLLLIKNELNYTYLVDKNSIYIYNVYK